MSERSSADRGPWPLVLALIAVWAIGVIWEPSRVGPALASPISTTEGPDRSIGSQSCRQCHESF